MTPRTALLAIRLRPARFLTSAWPWRALGYLLCSAALAYLCLLVGVGLARVRESAGLLTAWLLGLAVVTVAGLTVGRFEQWRLQLVDLGAARQVRQAWAGGPRTRLRRWVRAQVTWRQMAYAMVSMVALWWLDVLAAGIVLVPGVLLTAPFQPSASAAQVVAGTIAGVVLLPLTAYPVTAWAGLRAAMGRAILTTEDPELLDVVHSRARLVDAFQIERRRLERDLHDGTQQRLVTLSMKLGLIQLDLPAGSAAGAQVGEAHELAKTALAELRELIRGVHPHVLTDRGLEAAAREAASRSPVPVELSLSIPRRPPPAVEVAAYYAACEALSNVAKHSGASRCWINARLLDDVLILQIGDDGDGGADPATGTGLVGLADRIAVVDGRLLLSSPPGGPTVLQVEIPCSTSG